MLHDPQVESLSPAKRAVYEIRVLRKRIEELERNRTEPIAVIGAGLRFPGGAVDLAGFWQILASGTDTVTEVPASRWPLDQYYDPNPDAPGKMYTRHGAFVESGEWFDADFFGISPREAASLDPQHRLALEVSWEALENAGHDPASLKGTNSGVFLALSNSDYGRAVFGHTLAIDAYASTGNVFSVAAGRISYTLGFAGPSLVVDTACSGSLVAMHLACQSLRLRECGLALAGGINLILSPEININFSKSRMMAADGKCKTFDSAADGYVRGEGCGIVVLKRLSDAVADGDRVLALLRGSAVNQDGRSGGLTIPNGTAQQAVIRQALANAGVQPEEIGYVEAHGTGTALGDPIEAHALAAVFGPGRSADSPLVLGSVKTNLGHLEAAAGVAGLIKVVLALQKEHIPAHLHFHRMNPHIDWNGAPVEIPVNGKPWPRGEKRRVAGVSSFGFSGTNAHVIVEEAPLMERPRREIERRLHLLALSGRSAEALGALKSRYAEALEETCGELGDICYTANAGRAHFQWRAAYIGATKEEMREALLGPGCEQGTQEGAAEVVFLFSGQGAQYAGMGKELYDSQPVFRQAIEECGEILKEEVREPLQEVLWGRSTAFLDQTLYTQPALFAVEYALAELWKSWGIEPGAVLGHSVGEYVAACVAGVYSLAEGLHLIAARGRLMQAVAGEGAMSAVLASEERIREALRGMEERVTIAAMNGPESAVISGYTKEVGTVEERLRAMGVRVQRLRVSHGFHSPQMREMEGAFAAVAGGVRCGAPRVRLISSVTGQAVGREEMSEAQYWVRQVREPVRFRDAMETLGGQGARIYVEIGPGTTLVGLGRQCVGGEGGRWVASLKKGRGEWEQILESLGRLYVEGAEVNWAGFDAPYGRRRVELPTYPFERKRYWIERKTTIAASAIDEDSQWQRLCAHASRQSQQGRLDLEVAKYPERWALLNRLTTAYMIATLRQLGAYRVAGERHSAQSLREDYKIRAPYERLMQRWLKKLAKEKVLLQDGRDFVASLPLQSVEIESLITAARTVFSGDPIFLDYTIACGGALTEVLTGKESPLETLFPSGDFARAESLYEHSPVSAYFSSIARGALEGILEASTASLQVLEIGAGTGGTTSALLPALKADAAVYYFTDVSDIFLNHAERKFADYPFVRYERLDIETGGADAGYADGSFDVIVATNVLHATQDICSVIAKVKSLLAPGGVLILCEATEYQSWFDVTTALIEGWQRFDDGLRGDHPLLPSQVWENLLRNGGFDRVASFPGEDSPALVLGQHVIVARTPLIGARSQNSAALAGGAHISGQRNAEIRTPDRSGWLEMPASQRHEELVELVRQHLAEMLRFDSPSRIERKRRLMDIGLDSLMTLELRDRLGKALHSERPLSATLVFDYPTLDALADYLELDVLGLEREPARAGAGADRGSIRAAELQQLAEEEVEALLLEKLRSL